MSIFLIKLLGTEHGKKVHCVSIQISMSFLFYLSSIWTKETKEGKSSFYLEGNGDIKAQKFLFGQPPIVLLSSQGLDTQHSPRGSQGTDSGAGNPSLAPGGCSQGGCVCKNKGSLTQVPCSLPMPCPVNPPPRHQLPWPAKP